MSIESGNVVGTTREGESSASSIAEKTLPVTCAGDERPVDVALARKRKSWREASRWYRRKAETHKVRLDKAKARSATWRRSKSQEDMESVRKQIRELKAKRIRQESKNERFWRLLRRRDEKRIGYSNLAFYWEINQARRSGIFRHDKDFHPPQQFSESTVRSEEMVKVRHEFREEFEKFYDMLHSIENGSIEIGEISKSFDDFFKDRQLTMRSDFVKEYISESVIFNANVLNTV